MRLDSREERIHLDSKEDRINLDSKEDRIIHLDRRKHLLLLNIGSGFKISCERMEIGERTK